MCQKAVDFKSSRLYNRFHKVKELDMTEPTRGTINKNILKVLDLAIENQKEINKVHEQLISMVQTQAVVIKDIIDGVDLIDEKVDNIHKRMDWNE